MGQTFIKKITIYVVIIIIIINDGNANAIDVWNALNDAINGRATLNVIYGYANNDEYVTNGVYALNDNGWVSNGGNSIYFLRKLENV